MLKEWTWLRLLTALLVLPMVLVAGVVKTCPCNQEQVPVAKCCCCHEHAASEEHHHHQPAPQAPEHRCAHVQNDMQPVSVQVQLPDFSWDDAPLCVVPDFHLYRSCMHSCVMLTLARSRLWEPPETVNRPMLI